MVPKPCLTCGMPTEHGSYCRLHRRQQGGTGQRGSTRKWRRTRQLVLARDGHRCTDITDGVRCPNTEDLSVDHIVPKARGGTDLQTNLRTLCATHHKARHGRKAAA